MLGELVGASCYIYILAIVYSLVEHLYILLVGPCLRSWLHKRLSRRGPIFYGQARQKFHRLVWFLHHIPIIPIFPEKFSLIFSVTDSLPMAKWKAGGAILWRLADANQLGKGHDPHDMSLFFLELHFLYFPVSNNSISPSCKSVELVQILVSSLQVVRAQICGVLVAIGGMELLILFDTNLAGDGTWHCFVPWRTGSRPTCPCL